MRRGVQNPFEILSPVGHFHAIRAGNWGTGGQARIVQARGHDGGSVHRENAGLDLRVRLAVNAFETERVPLFVAETHVARKKLQKD